MNYEDYAFIIAAAIPDHTEFGIDLMDIEVTDEFRGIKLVPIGVHFIYTAALDTYGNKGSRVGFLHYFNKGEILVRQWNKESEELEVRDRPGSDIEIQRIKENLKHLDRYLALYDYENITKWKSLSNHLTHDAIKRLSPEAGMIRNEGEFIPCSDENRPRGGTNQQLRNIKIRSVDDENIYLPEMEKISNTEPKYTNLPDRFNQNLSPSEITMNHVDTINLIDKLFTELTTETEILEELQFSFLVYFCIHSIESLAHWRRLLSIFSNSDLAVAKYKNFYQQFVNVIKVHIPELPIEFLEQGMENTIYVDIRNLLINLINNNMNDLSNSLQRYILREIRWIFDNLDVDDPEDQPQIVELNV